MENSHGIATEARTSSRAAHHSSCFHVPCCFHIFHPPRYPSFVISFIEMSLIISGATRCLDKRLHDLTTVARIDHPLKYDEYLLRIGSLTYLFASGLSCLATTSTTISPGRRVNFSRICEKWATRPDYRPVTRAGNSYQAGINHPDSCLIFMPDTLRFLQRIILTDILRKRNLSRLRRRGVAGSADPQLLKYTRATWSIPKAER